MQVKQVLIYCGNLIPQESAATNYIINFARIYREAGIDVLFISEVNPPVDSDLNGCFLFRDFRCVAVGRPKYYRFPFGALNCLRFTSPALKYIKGLKPDNLLAIVTFGGVSILLLQIYKWARLNNVFTMAISAEHHLPSHYLRKFDIASWIDHEIRIRVINRLSSCVTVLSNYSQSFYQKRNATVHLVRPMIDTQSAFWQGVFRDPNKTLHVLFMGSPRRDRQDLILEGVRLAIDRGVSMRITYAGVSREALAAFMGKKSRLISLLGKSISFAPWIPWQEIPTLLADADYCVLFREDVRDMQYGFPSKTVEILSKGTPIICNKSSDLFDYIKSGENGFLVHALDAKILAETFIMASKISKEEYLMLRHGARRTAENSFDFRLYVPWVRALHKIDETN